MPKERVRRQLQEAALTLFRERGYDNTTTMEIAAQIGVTERTFFRYFPSKREVLFDEAALQDGLNAAVAAAPNTLPPMAVLHHAFRSLIPLLEDNRSLSEPARDLIAQTPALYERHLAKADATMATVARTLAGRGIDPDIATLAAASGMAVFAQAMQMWFDDASVRLSDHLDQAFQIWQQLAPGAC